MHRNIDINFDWLFIEGFDEDYVKVDCDESGFQTVHIPHNTRDIPFNNFDERDYQMLSCYRKHLTLEPLQDGQRLYMHFGAVMTAATVYMNGQLVGGHLGGYTPFRVDVTDAVQAGENVMTVVVDSTERDDIPPFGHVIDYLTYGGIYREVQLEYRHPVHIEHMLVQPRQVTEMTALLQVTFGLLNTQQQTGNVKLAIHITDPDGADFTVQRDIALSGDMQQTITVEEMLEGIHRWDIDDPHLYTITARLLDDHDEWDRMRDRIGFRDIHFTPEGFYLNGRKVKIQGLNRHQSFPYVGYAMPRSAQYRDAEILKYDLGLNAVRLSHYPQSDHFMDRCNELGLLTFVEIPGWQHIGEDEWQDVAVGNVSKMILKDNNHPSVILWGVRINESPDHDELYARTNAAAHALDATRPTGGVRCIADSHLMEDVYTYNDFSHTGDNAGLQPKRKVTKTQKPYMVTEYNGHMYPTKKYDDERHRIRHVNRHLKVMDAIQKDDNILGGFGWCMFDYNTHKDFGSGDRICYHGVMDMFRLPKDAAYAYASQQDGDPVLHLTSTFNIGEHEASLLGDVMVLTNCDSVKLYKNGHYIQTFYPRRDLYPHLAHPPVIIDDFIGDAIEQEGFFSKQDAAVIKRLLSFVSKHGDHLSLWDKLAMARLFIKYKMNRQDAEAIYTRHFGGWGDEATVYRIDGYKGEQKVASVTKSPAATAQLHVALDTDQLVEDATYDTTRMIIELLDEEGNPIRYANDAFIVETAGPIAVIGPKVIALRGGSTGLWIKSTGASGSATITVHSERFGDITKTVEVVKR